MSAPSHISPQKDIRAARLVLNALPGIGPVTSRRLMDALGGDPTAIFHATRQQLPTVKGVGKTMAENILGWRTHIDPARELEKITAHRIHFIIPEDTAAYPPLLRQIYDPPLGLYSTSDSFTWGERCVGIVGSRFHTAYGRQMAHSLARELAASGWCVVSGLARGIDTAAHKGALEAGGPTVAVLGCGLDIIYPPENRELYRQIAENGAVLSEFFLGKQADKLTFPMRNRIISGLARAVVIVESDETGGSMITARLATEQNRLVCAVPGRADQRTSRGCHALIRDGATLVTCVDDILSELGEAHMHIGPEKAKPGACPAQPKSIPANIGPLEQKVLQCLSGGMSLNLDTLAEQTAQPVSTLSGTLLMMELDRLVVKTADGCFEATS